MPDDALMREDALASVERALERLHRKHAEIEHEIGTLQLLLRAARSEHDYLKGCQP